MLLVASSILVAVIACIFAFGLIGTLMLVGWRERPILEIPPRRYGGDSPDEIRRLPERERRRIVQLARSGKKMTDPIDARLVHDYCAWALAQSSRLAFRQMARPRYAVWLGTTAVYVFLLVVAILKVTPWLVLFILPSVAIRIGVISGVLPRLASRKYRKTCEANGWTDQVTNPTLSSGQ